MGIWEEKEVGKWNWIKFERGNGDLGRKGSWEVELDKVWERKWGSRKFEVGKKREFGFLGEVGGLERVEGGEKETALF